MITLYIAYDNEDVEYGIRITSQSFSNLVSTEYSVYFADDHYEVASMTIGAYFDVLAASCANGNMSFPLRNSVDFSDQSFSSSAHTRAFCQSPMTMDPAFRLPL